MNNKKYISAAMTLAIAVTLITTVPALADTTNPVAPTQNHNKKGMGMHPRMVRGMMKGKGVFGSVTAINGNTITISSRMLEATPATNTTIPAQTTTTYTIDATNTKFTKGKNAATLADIKIGDVIFAQGTVTGTNVVAVNIMDGMIPKGDLKNDKNKSPMMGNGQPLIVGIVSSINGSTITITNRSGSAYTIDATNAKVMQGQNTITTSDINVGDMIIAQGTVNGTNVLAANIMDRKAQAINTTTGTSNEAQPKQNFFGRMGNFFSHLF